MRNRDRFSRGRNSDDNSKNSYRGKRNRFIYQERTADDIQHRQDTAGNDRPTFYDKSAGFNTYSPQNGSNCIRHMPPTWQNAKHFGYDVYVHYGIGPDEAAVLCPKMMRNEPCPVCEEKTEAERSGDKDYAQDLTPTHRVMYWLIDRDNEGKGVQLWVAPFTTIDKVITTQTKDKRTGELLLIDHPEHGYDVNFEKEGPRGQNKFAKYVGVAIARRESDLGRNAQKYLDFVVENPLPDLLIHHSYEEIQDIMSGGYSNSEDEEEEKQDSRKTIDEDDLPTWKEVQEMDFDELDSLCEEFNIDLYADEFDSEKDFADELCEELGLRMPKRELSNRNRMRKSLRDV